MQGKGIPNGMSPQMTTGIPTTGVAPVLSSSMQQGMQQQMPQQMPQGMPQQMPQQMPQGIPQGVPQAHQYHAHSEMSQEEEGHAKEADSINGFLNTINEFQLPISDKVINNICAQAGFSTTDPRLSRLLSLASEYFIIFAVNECRKVSNNRSDLQLTDVKKAFEKLNINIYRPDYIINTIESETANMDDNQMFDFIDDSQMFD